MLNKLFNPRNKKIFFIELTIIIILLALAIFLGLKRNNTTKEIAVMQTENRTLSNKIDNKQIVLNRKASKEALADSDNQVKMSALQVSSAKVIDSKVKKLFPILLNYSSGKEYEKRADLAKPYLSSNLLKSKNLFADDKLKNSNESYIDAVELNSKFKNVASALGLIKNGHISVLIITSYESWYSGGRHGIGQDVYEGQFNIKSGKFDKLARLNNLYSGRTDN